MTSESKKAFDHYLQKARAARSADGFVFQLEVPALLRSGEATTNELASAEQDDHTPDLLVVDEYQPLRWQPFLDTLLQHVYAAVGAAAGTIKPAPVVVQPPPLSKVLDLCDDERRRLGTAVGGNNSDKPKVKLLRAAIFSGRTPNRTRPGYESEFETIIASIKNMPDAPSAVRRMLPRLQAALNLLKGLPPTHPGRQAKEEEPPPPVPVQEAALALHFALGDLLSQASWAATDARLASLTRIIMGRKRSEGSSETHVEVQVEAPPAPGPVAAGTAGQGAASGAAKPAEGAQPAAPEAGGKVAARA